MGAARDVALTELPLRGISINADASGVNAFTLIPSDSGIIFVNGEDATGQTVYTLPTPTAAEGKWFWFFNAQTSQFIKTLSGTADTFIGGGAETGDYMDTNAAYIGDAAIVISDGDFFYLLPISGTWDTGDT